MLNTTAVVVEDYRNPVIYNLNLPIRLDYDKIFLIPEIKDERTILYYTEEGINELT